MVDESHYMFYNIYNSLATKQCEVWEFEIVMVYVLSMYSGYSLLYINLWICLFYYSYNVF
jgi:hypothetical protein